MNIFNRLSDEKIVPVIKLQSPDSATPLADALIKGGINVAEVTFRTDAAAESIKKIRTNFPEMLVGAGTVLNLENAKKAEDAGASFMVAPGFNPKIVQFCLDRKIPVVPGVTSPSEVEQAMEMGLEVLKFFPAELSGGIPMLKTLASVYTAKFMPTGGLNADNFIDYLKLSNVIACGGSWMVGGPLVESGNFEEITRLSAEVRRIIKANF
ncbi:MAG: bifunctional 4-hydroxy-2-oxoglutarate aldolase/2-dehydro-3-deoxy-phosphogluconate aldolase [Spirochaetales bacterium]|nr:bifunctional 4-hydroxy-2-oxoglutarate aldolase/2-dehydro-3-deoxy-phosphogluconate aldolase [Spirochaetales bacterium]